MELDSFTISLVLNLAKPELLAKCTTAQQGKKNSNL